MSLVLLFAAWVNAQVPALGADRYDVREWATARLSNPVAALFLPRSDPDPEVNHRLAYIRARQLRWINPVYVERVIQRDSFGAWLDLYFVSGRSQYQDAEVYDLISYDYARIVALSERWALPSGEWVPLPYLMPLDEFLDWCRYHRCAAPQPREK